MVAAADKLLALRHLGLLARSPRRIAYLGWVGRGNMGDEALLEVARRSLPGMTVQPWPEGRLGSALTRAPRQFDAALLGGGTLIGTDRFRSTFESIARHQPHAPLLMVGAGVEDPELAAAGSGTEIAASLDRWVPLLRRFERVTVRGPRSRMLLGERGVDAEVVGDPALLLGRAIPFRAQEERVLGVNLLSWGRVFGDDPGEVADTVAIVCRALIADGWRIRLIPMWSRDLDTHRRVQAELGAAAELFMGFGDLEALIRALGACRVVLGAKLHALVLAAAAGVPSVALAYSPKCLDFQLSVDQGDLAFRTDALDAGALRDVIDEVDRAHADRRRRLTIGVGSLQAALAREYEGVRSAARRGA
jgi:Polysaccharide pyruvyl transferase